MYDAGRLSAQPLRAYSVSWSPLTLPPTAMPQVPLRLRKAQAVKSGVPKTLDPQPVAKGAPSEAQPAPFFPLARYASVTVVHACLLGFTALYLPRSSLSFFTSSNPFNTPTETSAPSEETTPDALYLLTSNPARTVAWLAKDPLM